MLNIGCHLSTSKGYYNMGKTILKLGGNTFQFFSRNPRGGKTKNLDYKDIDNLKNLLNFNNFAPILSHAPYILNMAAAKESIYNFSKIIFREDLEKLETMPCNLYNFHPGCYTEKSIEYGIEKILKGLKDVVFKECTTTILFETMSGKGTEIGKNLKEISFLLKNVDYPEKFGVCLDTCHLWEAGYDLKNDLENVIKDIDKYIGIDKIKAIHLNDSKNSIGTKKDRHEKIGKGFLGIETIYNIITHKLLKNKPFFLETPNNENEYKKEIEFLKDLELNGFKKYKKI